MHAAAGLTKYVHAPQAMAYPGECGILRWHGIADFVGAVQQQRSEKPAAVASG